MEFRGGGGQDEGMGGYNPSTPIKNSAFSKPTLSPSSTLLISPRGFPHPGGARNGNCAFEVPSSSSSPLNPLHSRALDSTELPPATTVQYKECLRNHAASIGGHVVDGCGEFMPGSGDDAMKCDACGCHRSFHRKDSYGDNRVPLLLAPPPPSSATESSSEELNAVAAAHHRSAAVASASVPRKRFRTKFTAEQKERMLGFAESVGWRIQRQDEATVEQFCAEVGVKRQVLKVWMHNNKHSIRRHLHHLPHHQQQQQQQQQQHHHQEQGQEQEQEQAQDQDQQQTQQQQQQQMQEE